MGFTWVHTEVGRLQFPFDATVEFGLEDDGINNLAKAEFDDAALHSQLVSRQGQ